MNGLNVHLNFVYVRSCVTRLKRNHLTASVFLYLHWCKSSALWGVGQDLVSHGEQSYSLFPFISLDLLKTLEKMSIKFLKFLENKGLCKTQSDTLYLQMHQLAIPIGIK